MKSKQNWADMLPTEIIYQHENITHGENGFTKPDLIAICEGKEETARALFDLLDWQHPATLLDEWFNEGEVDEHCNIIKDNKDFNHDIVKIGGPLYKVFIPQDAHAFDIDNQYLYYWRLKDKDVKLPLPVTGNWSIEQTSDDYLILKVKNR